MVESPWSLLHRFKADWRLLAPLLLLNLAGLVFGYYYYHQVGQFDLDQLACGEGATEYCQPAWLWPLVADSPNAVLLFMVATLAYRLTGWRSKWLDALAFTLNVYVGLWTTFLFLAYPGRMGTFDYASILEERNANPVLFIAHMGMPLQAFVLAKDMQTDAWRLPQLLLVGAALATYVAVDYSAKVGAWLPEGVLHPAPFLHPDDALLHTGSPWLMALTVAAWIAVAAWRRPQGPTESPISPRSTDGPDSHR